MATLAELRRRTLDFLQSAEPQGRPLLHLINGSIANNTSTSVIVDDGTKFSVGNVIEFQDDGEQCYVLSISTNTLTVIRQFNGTTNASGHADNTPISKNPRFSWKQVEDSLTAVFYEFERHGVHAWGEGDLTLVDNTYFYDLAETDISPQFGVLSVHYEDASIDNRIFPLPFYRDTVHTTLNAAGNSIRLLSWGTLNAGDTVYYTYALHITEATDLLPRQEELAVLGAVSKMFGRTMAPRTTDPGKHTDRTVQPGQGMRDGRWAQGEFYIAMKAEAALLAAERSRHARTTATRRAGSYRP